MLQLVVSPGLVVGLGVTAWLVIIVQVLIGYRKIKFKGRTHMKVHKAVGWSLIALGLIHGAAALIYLGWLPL
jgi:hypothetical protein